MKNQRGVTLGSLVIYIIAMILIIGVMTSVTLNFNKNISNLEASTSEISKISDFNAYFVKEIKSPNNEVDRISDDGNYIIFKSGNSFSYSDKAIFYNNKKIVNEVKDINFSFTNQNVKDIITVSFTFEKFSKNINYKVEEIY